MNALLGITLCTSLFVGCGDSKGQPIEGSDANQDGTVGSLSAIPGIVLWLDAAKGVTANQASVVSWADQSGNHNDASQQDASWQPSLVATGINGLPVVHFTANAAPADGVSSYGNVLNIADSTTLQWGSDDYLIEVVTRYDNVPTATFSTDGATGYGTLYSKQTTNPALPATGVALFANTPAGDNANGTTAFSSVVEIAHGVTNTTTGFNDGTARLLGTQRTGGTSLALRVNATQTATATVTSIDVDEPATGVRLGASSDATTARLDGDIAEMIAVKGTISATDLTTLETYLTTKYGL